MAKKEIAIEQAFEDLEEILRKLESEDTKLKESMDLYAKGVKLLNDCQASLDKVEKQMIILEGEAENEL